MGSQCEPCDISDVNCPTAVAPTPMQAPGPASTPWPTPEPTYTRKVAPVPTLQPTSRSVDSPTCLNAAYGQCGGQGFTGYTCCSSKMWCEYINEWWSQCTPCGHKW